MNKPPQSEATVIISRTFRMPEHLMDAMRAEAKMQGCSVNSLFVLLSQQVLRDLSNGRALTSGGSK